MKKAVNVSFSVLNTIILQLFFIAPSLFAVKTWDYRPDYFPYQFRIADLYEDSRHILTDLDNDDLLELITSESERLDATPANVIVRDMWLNLRFQYNYPAQNVKIMRRIQTLNVNSDPAKELIVPVIKNDSLFLDVLSADGDFLNSIFLTSRPAVVHEKSIPWDCGLSYAAFFDLDGDYKKELVTVMRSGYALHPRGVFVHSYPAGELLGHSLIGAQPNDIFFDDFDDDGHMEMIIHSSTPNNGALASGLTDRFPYVLYYEFKPEPVLLDSLVLGNEVYTRTTIFHINFAGDVKKELVTFRMSMDSHAPAEINVIDPMNFSQPVSRLFNLNIKSVCTFFSPGAEHAKILAVDTTNTLLLFDNQFNISSPVEWPEIINSLMHGPDVDNDGYPETIIHGKFHSVLVDHNFDILVIWPAGENYERRLNVPGQTSPLLMTSTPGDYRLYQIDPSLQYIMYRYGFPVLGLLFVLMIFIILVFGVKEHHQHKTINRYIEHIIESDSRAIAIVDKNLHIINCNQQLLDWFGKSRDMKRPSFAEWFQEYPQLVSTVRDWQAGYSDIRRDKSITLDTSLGLRTLRLTFEPVPKPLFTKRVYQITLNDESIHAELQKAKNWTRLAQRVAHDIKNPLGTILLILQKIRNLSEKKGQDYADAVAPHISKIEDRIESLRVMTRNFMKYINLETPHFSLINLNEFLNGTLETISKTVPPDIALLPQIPDSITAVEIDTEQIASVIENLISNAIDAMPKGGSITLSSRLAHRLQFPGYDDRPRDYTLIEIRDTGLGIPPDVVERLFEPNFSYSKESSGLGLAMSKKIIEDHHGFIEVESEIDTGTLFTIYLPAKSVL